jgi:hypothetical protein
MESVSEDDWRQVTNMLASGGAAGVAKVLRAFQSMDRPAT